jgi:DNA-binding Lrp family transcriptional regulator
MTLTAYLSGAHRLRLSTRRDEALVAWLRANANATASEAATALGWSVHRTHRRLLRLEREGHVQAYTAYGEFFNDTVYCAPGRTP